MVVADGDALEVDWAVTTTSWATGADAAATGAAWVATAKGSVLGRDVAALAVARSTAFAGSLSTLSHTNRAAPTISNAVTAASRAFAGRVCFAPDIVTEEGAAV